jgi:cobalt/nickel transport system ATP-binding protein
MHHSIEIHNLTYSYPDGHAALNDISLRIAPGEKVALVGPNGAGKSTLMLHLNGILTGRGNVHVCGLEVEPKNFSRVRACIGLVFQNPDDQLFSPTVFDDVAFGPLYQGLGAEETRQRVESALAAVLSMNPEALALDEPTAGLDPRARRALIHLLRDLPITMLVSTHDMALVKELFPRTIVMDEGQVVADGLTSEILENEELLNAHGLEKA